MESRAERVNNFSRIFSESRYDAGKSQEYMAAELGVSRKTIQNWESGVSSPSYFQMLEWFRALNLSEVPYIHKYKNSEIINNDSLTKEEKLEKSFDATMKELNVAQKRAIIYLLKGTYQGDPYSLLQLFVAHAHLPMQHRFFIATQISETYKMCEMIGNLRDTKYILPDMEVLDKAINAGREAAVKGFESYSMT